MAPTIAPYTGPRPAPSHRWAPWVLATAAALVVLQLVATAVNLWERSILGHPVSTPSQLERTHQLLSTLKVTGRVTLGFVALFFVLDVTWSVKRRTRTRVQTHGERGVEPRLRTAFPAIYFGMMSAGIAGVVVSRIANGQLHLGMTRHEFVGYRTLYATSHTLTAVFWASFVVLVLNAQALQRAREAQSLAP